MPTAAFTNSRTAAEASSIIEQRVDEFGASLKLSVTNGEKSSVISLTGDGINQSGTVAFTGEVVFKSDLSTAGSTTINGANVTTDNLYVQKVYYRDSGDRGYFPVLSSEIDTVGTIPNTFTYVGPKDLGGRDSKLDGYMQSLELYGAPIYFGRPGFAARQDKRALMVDVTRRTIRPTTDGGHWDIGTENYPFAAAYFVDAYFEKSYLYDYGGSGANAGWSELYADGHELYWEDAGGVLYKVRLSEV
jgi:hypothetical protein